MMNTLLDTRFPQQVFRPKKREKTIYLLLSLFIAAIAIGLPVITYLADPADYAEGRVYILLMSAVMVLVAIAVLRMPFSTIKLTLSPIGIEYNDGAASIMGTWEEVERIGTQTIGARTFEGLFLRKPSYVTPKWMFWVGLVPMFFGKEIRCFINLSIFEREWRDSEIGRAIKHHAPELFYEGGQSEEGVLEDGHITATAAHSNAAGLPAKRIGGWLVVIGLWLILVALSSAATLAISSMSLFSGQSFALGADVGSAALSDLQWSMLLMASVNSLLVLAFVVPVMIHYFSKTAYFPKIMRAFLITVWILDILSFVALQAFRYASDLEIAPSLSFNISNLLFVALVLYMGRSERVKETFVR